jgi:hypothetical protein
VTRPFRRDDKKPALPRQNVESQSPAKLWRMQVRAACAGAARHEKIGRYDRESPNSHMRGPCKSRQVLIHTSDGFSSIAREESLWMSDT